MCVICPVEYFRSRSDDVKPVSSVPTATLSRKRHASDKSKQRPPSDQSPQKEEPPPKPPSWDISELTKGSRQTICWMHTYDL